MKDDIQMSKPMQAVGINPRFIYLLLGFFLVLVVTIGVLFVSESPKAVTHKEVTDDNKAIAESQIAAILHEKKQSPIVKAKDAIVLTELDVKAYGALSEQDFKQGAGAQLSVYRPTDQSFQQETASQLGQVHYANSSIPKRINEFQQQNGQEEKQQFMREQQVAKPELSQERVHGPISKFQLMAGTILPATLLTGINSDLPNQIIAKIRRPIYDTVTGRYLLVPQGATLIGEYDSKVTFGQSRVMIAWSRIIFPNGASLNLEGQPGADLMGMAGLSDRVDHHTLRLFSSALLMSVFSAAGQVSQPQTNSNSPTTSQIIYGAIGQQVSQTAAQMIAKQMNVQPTITIRPGMNFNILLTRDFIFPGVYGQFEK